MEELDLKEIFSVFWTKKIYIVLFIILFGVIGGYYSYYFVTPMYKSSTTLVLVKTADGTDTQALTQADVTLNQKLVSTYSEIIKSKKVTKQVIQELGLDMSEGDFAKNITVAAVKNTEVINVTMKNEDAKVAADVANKIAEVFSKEVSDIYNMQNISIIDGAEEATSPYNINHKKTIAIFAAVGMILTMIIIFLVYILDTTIKTAEDVEKYLGLSVLSMIPICKETGGKR